MRDYIIDICIGDWNEGAVVVKALKRELRQILSYNNCSPDR